MGTCEGRPQYKANARAVFKVTLVGVPSICRPFASLRSGQLMSGGGLKGISLRRCEVTPGVELDSGHFSDNGPTLAVGPRRTHVFTLRAFDEKQRAGTYV